MRACEQQHGPSRDPASGRRSGSRRAETLTEQAYRPARRADRHAAAAPGRRALRAGAVGGLQASAARPSARLCSGWRAKAWSRSCRARASSSPTPIRRSQLLVLEVRRELERLLVPRRRRTRHGSERREFCTRSPRAWSARPRATTTSPSCGSTASSTPARSSAAHNDYAARSMRSLHGHLAPLLVPALQAGRRSAAVRAAACGPGSRDRPRGRGEGRCSISTSFLDYVEKFTRDTLEKTRLRPLRK